MKYLITILGVLMLTTVSAAPNAEDFFESGYITCTAITCAPGDQIQNKAKSQVFNYWGCPEIPGAHVGQNIGQCSLGTGIGNVWWVQVHVEMAGNPFSRGDYFFAVNGPVWVQGYGEAWSLSPQRPNEETTYILWGCSDASHGPQEGGGGGWLN